METPYNPTDHPQNHADGVETSGRTTSYWLDSVQPLAFTKLASDLETDVVIVGAGISGMTTAYCLAKEGYRVVVLEDGFVGSGETGRTTAHIANALDDGYYEIEQKHGKEGAIHAADSHTAAIAMVESIVLEEEIDCDFRRLDGYMFLHPTDKPKTLEQEHEATHRAGIPTQLIEGVPGLENENGICLKFPQQAQFHPMKYLKGLTEAAVRYGAHIFTESKVTAVDKTHVEANGHRVNASHIVVATN